MSLEENYIGLLGRDLAAIRVPWLCPECNGNGESAWPTNPTICGGSPCPVCDGICPNGHKDAPTIIEVLAAGEALITARREGGGLWVKAPPEDPEFDF